MAAPLAMQLAERKRERLNGEKALKKEVQRLKAEVRHLRKHITQLKKDKADLRFALTKEIASTKYLRECLYEVKA